MKAPLALALALSGTVWPVTLPPPLLRSCPAAGPRQAYLGFRYPDGPLMALHVVPVEVGAPPPGPCVEGTKLFDPVQHRALICEKGAESGGGGSWSPYLGVNVVLIVESGSVESLE